MAVPGFISLGAEILPPTPFHPFHLRGNQEFYGGPVPLRWSRRWKFVALFIPGENINY